MALLCPPVSTCKLLQPTVAERVRDQPLAGKGIIIKTELLFVCIHLNYNSSGEYTGDTIWAMSEKVTAKTSLGKMQLALLAYTCSESVKCVPLVNSEDGIASLKIQSGLFQEHL